jgi:hypothetical protein
MNKKLFVFIFAFLLNTSFVLAQEYKANIGACYKNREIMYPLEETFEALKQTLMESNLNIVTVTKEDGILTAKGSTYNDDEDTITNVIMTISFKGRDDNMTSVRAIASYSTQERKNDTGQIGAAGISLPIPVPFTQKYTLTSSGNIDDPIWYQGFFNSLEKVLFENHIKYVANNTLKEKQEKNIDKQDNVTNDANTNETNKDSASKTNNNK